MEWANQRKNIGGILTPDIEGKRKLYNIATKEYFDFQSDVPFAGKTISIGKFHFEKEVFAKAQQILLNSTHQTFDWTIVDEIGKLELQQSGLEPAVSELIKSFQVGKAKGNLLLLIRDYLLDDCISYYQLQGATHLTGAFFKAPVNENLGGALILCGGKSSRMQTDKSLINYHGKPQRYYLYEVLRQIYNDIFISCNKEQAQAIGEGYNFIVDDEKYSNSGPMGGLLSAFEKHPDKSFLVVGCDYPFITIDDIAKLINARSKNAKAVCYFNSETNFAEPLLAVYEKECYELLQLDFKKNNFSLRHFLDEINAEKIIAVAPQKIKSIDTLEDYHKVRGKIFL